MVIAAIDPEPGGAQALKDWGRAYWQAVHPYNMEGGYTNFMMDDEADERLHATFGDNWERLAAVKTKYDPDNFFRVNQNIRPQEGAGL
jgi:FAD/FMN-containing dehydrogenase